MVILNPGGEKCVSDLEDCLPQNPAASDPTCLFGHLCDRDRRIGQTGSAIKGNLPGLADTLA